MQSQLENKNSEINYLRIELNNLVEQNNRLIEDKNELEKIVNLKFIENKLINI